MATITYWAEEEVAYLIDNYSKVGSIPIANKLNRTSISVRHKASKLGLQIPEAIKHVISASGLRTKWLEQIKVVGIKDGHSWKREVLRIGNYTCVDCGLYDPSIVVAHHIIPKHDNAELAFELSNGAILCPNCHAKRHLIIGRQSSGNRMTSRDKELATELLTQNKTIAEIAEILGFNHKTIQSYLVGKRGDY